MTADHNMSVINHASSQPLRAGHNRTDTNPMKYVVPTIHITAQRSGGQNSKGVNSIPSAENDANSGLRQKT